ncbi:MAG: methyl-accepting chemotaxis protein, partial [Promicromonosporaceae bacterium]|nr:methyl-accepting chemotaxis protein [Promicromonosporaceae bacterium]
FELKQDYYGEFATIREALLNLRGRLSETLNMIGDSSNGITSSSAQVSESVRVISQGARRQSESTGHLRDTVGLIAEQAAGNVGRAAKATENADLVAKRIAESNQQMQQMTQAMEDIKTSSDEIKKIMKTIDDIAFQTNILALNASVEAARAGSAGKGFAVVAEEVRNLAGKSADAAQNTAQLIENSLSAVARGATLAQHSSRGMEAIVEGSSGVANIIGEISQESEKQSSLIQEIRADVITITDVVRENTDAVDANIASSAELSNQAETLQNLVGQFNYDSRAVLDSGQSYQAPLIERR